MIRKDKKMMCEMLLDNAKFMTDNIGDAHIIYASILYLFVLLSTFIFKDMLLGVISEAVSADAATEKEELLPTT